MNPTLILADNYRMAVDYAREHDLGPEGREWVYVTSLRQVQGRRGPGWFVRVSIGEAPWAQVQEQRAAVAHLTLSGFSEVLR